MISLVMGLLGVKRGMSWAITLGGAAALAGGLWWAVGAWIGGIERDAMSRQRAADELAFSKAQVEAERKQTAKVEQARLQGIQIGKELSDGYARQGAAIDGTAAAMLGLWSAQAQTGAGRAGRGEATGISGAAARFDATAACPASGWVSLPLAVELAAGADREAARGDALSAFIEANAKAWPK